MSNTLARMRLLAAAVLSSAVLAGGASGAPSKLVGRWERVTTCASIANALRAAGLAKIAPAIIAGNGLVAGTPQQLARKANICSGAVPRRHSHFFTASGRFGSVDYNGKQVDDGTYRILDANTVRINDGTFHFTALGTTLTLRPVLSTALKRKALAHPLQFSTAGWMVAVSIPPGAWKRVPCAGWC
jgi:hypothetical protein